VVNLSYLQVLFSAELRGRGYGSWHLWFLLTQCLMHLSWQLTRHTSPGTFGLRAKDEYRRQYAEAVDEMCERGASTWSAAAGRRLCHVCRIVRPLRSKHSPSPSINRCVPRFDHHCP
jgi:hypothetical protein